MLLRVVTLPQKEIIKSQPSSLNQTIYGNQITQYLDSPDDWFAAFWARQKLRINPDQFKYKTGDQLLSIADDMEHEFRSYWHFRAKNTLSQLNLHLRRRHRMIAAYAF